MVLIAAMTFRVMLPLILPVHSTGDFSGLEMTTFVFSLNVVLQQKTPLATSTQNLSAATASALTTS